ncbi:Tubby-like, C-terminal [Sesbania bispinosa]|nr:Tubby-like, C-terminal [Sesbania bispinosa]
MFQVHNEEQEATCMTAYTLWMKSLVFHSNGCTVYDSNGEIVYRVDNYDKKGSRQRLLAIGRWDVYRRSSGEEKPWFQVKRCYKMMTGKVSSCEITVEYCQKYCIQRIGGKTAFRILDIHGEIVADAKQKHSSSGIVLGNDVLKLDVGADIDHSLIMAFVTVFGLICGRM